MVMTREERIQLLARAREVKAKKAQMLLANKVEEIEKGIHKNNNDDIKEIIKPKPRSKPKKATQETKIETTLELKLPEDEKSETEEKEQKSEAEETRDLKTKTEISKVQPEIKTIEQRVKIKAPKKKKIIKRIVEVEESDTEEEIIEEVVRVPKIAKDVKISRRMMIDKLQEQNRQRLMGELFN